MLLLCGGHGDCTNLVLTFIVYPLMMYTSRATTDMAAPSAAGGVTVDGEVTLSSRAPHAVR